MKIAILSLRRRFGDVTGDCVQADKTTAALCSLGVDARRYYLAPKTGVVYDASNRELGQWQEVFASMDIVHAIPPIPSCYIEQLPRIKAKLACSSVFWRSLTCTRVEHKNIGSLTLQLVKEYVRDLLALIGIKQLTAYRAYDLLLPNSEDEIRVLRKYARMKRGAKVEAVPNAIDTVPDYVGSLCRSTLVPKEDYILVPGYFAPRKNQMTLIRALKNAAYEVVFMGKGPCLEKCKANATSRMRFLGHIEHTSEEFYSIMKYARVVCLPSNCETPGIAGLEAAALGARPVVPFEGGTCQYYGWDAEYHSPIDEMSLRVAIDKAWRRGRLNTCETEKYKSLVWTECASRTIAAYERTCLCKRLQGKTWLPQ